MRKAAVCSTLAPECSGGPKSSAVVISLGDIIPVKQSMHRNFIRWSECFLHLRVDINLS